MDETGVITKNDWTVVMMKRFHIIYYPTSFNVYRRLYWCIQLQCIHSHFDINILEKIHVSVLNKPICTKKNRTHVLTYTLHCILLQCICFNVYLTLHTVTYVYSYNVCMQQYHLHCIENCIHSLNWKLYTLTKLKIVYTHISKLIFWKKYTLTF